MVNTTFDENGVEYLVPDWPLLLDPESYPKDLLKMSFINHTRVPDLYASCIILIVLTFLAVVLRCMARRKKQQNLGWDDHTIILGLVCFLTLAVSVLVYIRRGGIGSHEVQVTAAQEIEFFKVSLLHIQLLYVCTMGSIKLSILFLYLRLFGVSKRFRYALFGAVAIIVAWFGTCVTLAIMASWAVNYGSLTPRDSAIASGVTSLVTDVMVLCFPLRMVWRLKTNRQTKVKLISLFLLGLFVCITSLIRIIYLVKYVPEDQTYEAARIIVWTIAECGLSIITTCLPVIRLLFKPVPPASTSEASRTSYFWSRKKSTEPHHSSETRSWDKINRRGWSITKSHDESQVEIVRENDDVLPKESSQSKDEEMNWGSVELGQLDNIKRT